MISGPRGSGKNIFIVKSLKKSKRICYSNFKINFENYRPLKLIDMLSLPDKINLILDEGYTWLESRTSAKYLNLFMSYVVFQLRKTDRNIFVMVQEISSVDIRYRMQWDYYVMCERARDKDEKKIQHFWDFKYTIFDKTKKSISKWILPYSEAIKLFSLYDTNEIVPVSAKSRIEFEILKTEPKQFLTRVLYIASKIRPKIKVLTKDSIKLVLLVMGYDQVWHNSIFLVLKNYIALKK